MKHREVCAVPSQSIKTGLGEDGTRGKYVYSRKDPSIYFVYDSESEIVKARRKVRLKIFERSTNPYPCPGAMDAFSESNLGAERFKKTEVRSQRIL
jgi:hypothetical protein